MLRQPTVMFEEKMQQHNFVSICLVRVFVRHFNNLLYGTRSSQVILMCLDEIGSSMLGKERFEIISLQAV